MTYQKKKKKLEGIIYVIAYWCFKYAGIIWKMLLSVRYTFFL